jgi:uncharacterized protein DUF6292
VTDDVTFLRDNVAAGGDPAPVERPASNAATAVPDPLGDAIARHPTALGRHLDAYLDVVARELRGRGVITGSPQRTEPSQRLIGSIVVDCTAVRAAASADDQSSNGRRTSVVQPLSRHEQPAPVIVMWDEVTGWSAGLHHDPTSSSRRYLHSDLLPEGAAVAEFVVSLAEGRSVGAPQPACAPVTGRPALRLVR